MHKLIIKSILKKFLPLSIVVDTLEKQNKGVKKLLLSKKKALSTYVHCKINFFWTSELRLCLLCEEKLTTLGDSADMSVQSLLHTPKCNF